MKGDYETYVHINAQSEIMKNILANVFGERALMKDCTHPYTRVFADDNYGGDICLVCGRLKTWEVAKR